MGENREAGVIMKCRPVLPSKISSSIWRPGIAGYHMRKTDKSGKYKRGFEYMRCVPVCQYTGEFRAAQSSSERTLQQCQQSAPLDFQTGYLFNLTTES
ncbi:MAG: hypothetical protein L0229_19835 [Blastocatellia bacterium]|nr:hypothetical protein [Blastocatellia bacterium]